MRRMWAFTIAGAFLAFGAVSAEAQMRIGAKGGISFSTVSFDPEPTEGTSSVTGFVGGAEVQIPLGASGLILQPELLYTRKGVEFDEEIDGATITINPDYVEIPVLLRFNIPAQSVMPFVYGGGVVSFEASCNLKGEDGDSSAETDCAGDFESESTDFGVLFGGGLAFPAGPGDIFFEGRYTIGLVDVVTSDALEGKNRSGAVMVGYSVSLDPTRR